MDEQSSLVLMYRFKIDIEYKIRIENKIELTWANLIRSIY